MTVQIEEQEKTSAVSIRASDDYRNALHAYCRSKGVKIADVVRAAMDESLGDELRPFLAVFAASNGQSIIHKSNALSKEKVGQP